MKKLFFLTTALALVLGLSQCKKMRPDMPQYSGPVGDMYVQQATLKASQHESNSKVADDGMGCVKWELDDVITVSGGGTGTLICTDADGKEGTFTGKITKTGEGVLTFTYGDFSNFNEQDGSLTKALHLVGTSAFVSSPSGAYNVDMSIDYAVLKLDLSNVNMPVAEGKGTVVISDGTNTATVTFPEENKSKVYVAMPANSTPTEYTFNGYGMCKKWTLDANTFYTRDGGSKDGTGASIVVDPEWVDLGTGVKWALKNLGATCSTANPTDPKTATTWYGDYYAWGEVAPYYTGINWTSATSGSADGWKTGKTAGYDWGSYQWCKGSGTMLTKYNNKLGYGYEGFVDNKTTLEADDDAAYQNAAPANTWRMPTGGESGEWKQLKDNTLFVWTTSYRGISDLAGYVVYKVKATAHKGQRVTTTGDSGYTGYADYTYAITDPHMFLPAAGCFAKTGLSSAGSQGYYWSRPLYTGEPSQAIHMTLASNGVNPSDNSPRRLGVLLRPVR